MLFNEDSNHVMGTLYLACVMKNLKYYYYYKKKQCYYLAILNWVLKSYL